MSIEFINDFTAKMNNTTTEQYKNNLNQFLEKIDVLENAVNIAVIKNFEDYKKCSELKAILSSLFCFSFNNKLPEFEKIAKIESSLGKKLLDFVKKNTVKNSEIKTVVRYLLWGKYYSQQSFSKIYEVLKKHNLLRRQGDNLCVIGLHYKVGDNLFTVDYNGREHRQYVSWAGFQAFYNKSGQFKQFIIDTDKWNEIPELEDIYEITGLHDGKYAVRPIGLNKKERNLIQEKYTY